MAKSKKQDNAEAKEDIVMEVMPGADGISEDEAKPFEVDLNFEEDAPEEEAENEEVEQEVDAAPEEEVVAEEPEPEVAEEETVEPEAVSEEGVDENSEPASQPDIPAVEGSEQSLDGQDKVKAPMVPKSRLDEVLAKNKAMQKQLAEAAAAEKAAAENAPEYDFDAKEVEYQDLVLNGETEKAVELRNQIRQAEKDQFMFEVQAKMGQTVQQSQEMTELQAKAAEIEATYPMLSENDPSFDANLQAEVVELRDAFMSQGYSPADALGKATQYTIAAQKPELLNPAVENPTKKIDTAVQERQQVANVTKKLKAADAQPPAMKGESKTEKKIDLSLLSSEEFDALPAETLRRMRGDFG
jgi:hypothetical protein